MDHLPIHEIDAIVDAHIEATADQAQQKIDLCKIWVGVRPVIKFARALLFWKPKWQQVLDQLINNLDTNCNQA